MFQMKIQWLHVCDHILGLAVLVLLVSVKDRPLQNSGVCDILDAFRGEADKLRVYNIHDACVGLVWIVQQGNVFQQ